MRYQVYAERRVSTMVEVDAPDLATAIRLAGDEMPGDNLQDVDVAGEWETLSVTDETGKEVLTARFDTNGAAIVEVLA